MMLAHDSRGAPRKKIPPEWRPTELEIVKDGYYARVSLGYAYGLERWRWSVVPMELVQRIPLSPVESARSRGYTHGLEKSIKMAEAAIRALVKAEKK